MPTSTFPLWWDHDTIVQILNAARDGASYQDLDAIAQERTGSNRAPKLSVWVRGWKDRPTDRPQARLAATIASYSPPASRETTQMKVVESALLIHRALCECGERKDDPGDQCCRGCLLLETAEGRSPGPG